MKPLEKKVLGEFGCQKFIYCSDAGLASEDIRAYNHMGERSYIVTQSIKKLKKEEKEWALSHQGFKRVSDNKPVDISKLPEDDTGSTKKNRKNPNDPARFIGTTAVTKDGEIADIQHYLDEGKIEEEANSKTCLSAERKPHQGTFSDMFSLPDHLSFS